MYTIILKNEKLASYNRLGLFILLIHFLYFTGYFLKVNSNVNFLLLAGGIAAAFLGFVLNISSATKNKKPMIPFVVMFVIMAIAWAGLVNYWLTAAMIILAFLDVTVRKKPTVVFFDDRISIQAFPGKTYEWEDMSNVILKDDILTLDFKNDRLMQAEIDGDSFHVDEIGFNEFCTRRLEGK